MIRKSLVSIILLLVFLYSCAGSGMNDTAQNQFAQGLELYERGQYEEAIIHFRKATELDPSSGRSYHYLGRTYMNLWRWYEAVPPLRTALRLSPDEPETANLLTEALLGSAAHAFTEGKYQNSINYIREALRLDPQSRKIFSELLKTLLAYGADLLSRGNTDEAIQSFNEALQLSPDLLDAYLGLARGFFQKNDLFNALSAVEKALQLAPSNRDAESL